MTQILEENVRYGTGTRARLSDRSVAGKTGTTDEHADAWFIGYTPDVSTAVWMGYTRGEIPMENVHGISVSGGSFPAEIWRRFMEAALWRSPVHDFPDEPADPGRVGAVPARAVCVVLRPAGDDRDDGDDAPPAPRRHLAKAARRKRIAAEPDPARPR